MSTRHLLPSLVLAPVLLQGLAAQVTQFGSGCPSSNGQTPTIAVQGAPFANTAAVIDLTGPPNKFAYVMLSAQNQTWGSAPLPLDLALVGNPGCDLLVPPDLTFLVPLGGSGSTSLTLPFVLPANTTLYAQSAILFGQGQSLLDGISEGLEIEFLAPTSGLVIGSISQLSGQVGDMLTIRGANFGNGSPDDVCMAVVDANDKIQAFLKVETRSDTAMTAEIKAVRPGPLAGNLGFITGSGSHTTMPPTPGVTINQPVWSWRNPAVTPAEMAVSTQSFTPFESTDFSGNPCVPCQPGGIWFDVQGGQLVADLPDMCDGVIIEAYFSELWWLDTNGNYHRIESQTERVAICGMPAAARASYLALMLNLALIGDGLFANAPDPNTLEITVNGGASFMGGSLTLSYGYDSTMLVSATDGVCDNFAAPTEPAVLGADLNAWYAANTPSAPQRDFDETGNDKHFLHTIAIPPGPGTTVTGMCINMRIRGLSSLASNDSIALVVQGGSFVWGVRIEDLPETGGSWGTGDVADICLNLDDLPASSSGVTSVLSQAIAKGEVDVRLTDDTAVDCISLSVQRCQ